MLVWHPGLGMGGWNVMRWDGSAWRETANDGRALKPGYEPSHWMPLPSPPTDQPSLDDGQAMNVLIRKPDNDVEHDWADDEDRWFNRRDYPDDYIGSSTEQLLVAVVDGVRCVIRVEAPDGGDTGSRLAHAVADAICDRTNPSR